MPAWLPAVTGLLGVVVGSAVTLLSGLYAAAVSRRNQRDALAQQQSESVRGLILAAQERLGSESPVVRDQGLAILEAVVQMRGVGANDAILVQAVMRRVNGTALSRAHDIRRIPGTGLAFTVDDEQSEGSQ